MFEDAAALCGEMKEIEDVCVQELGQAEIPPHQITPIPDAHAEHLGYMYCICGCSHTHGCTARTATQVTSCCARYH